MKNKIESEKWLDVGCGQDKIHTAIGVDMIKLPEVDVVHDLNSFPWPFADNTFDHVVCKHSLEHLNNFIGVIEEIYRITKPDGIIEILVPHYASDNFNTDPTHRISFGHRTLDYFCLGTSLSKYQYYSGARFERMINRISFRENVTDFRKHTKFNPMKLLGVEYIVNRLPRMYERFFVYWFPPSEIYFKLKVIK